MTTAIAPKPEYQVDSEWCPIWKAIPQIIGAIKPIAKAHRNTQQNYTFRGVDDVYAVLNLLLERFGVSVIPEVLKARRESYQTKNGTTMFKAVLRVRYQLVASDGTAVFSVVEGEGMDSGDKSTQKALSMAYKYMAFQVFCIPTGEKIDTENDSPQVVGAAQAPPKPKAIPPAHQTMWQRIKTLAVDYDYPCGQNDSDLKAAVKGATGKTKPSELTEDDFLKIEAELAAVVKRLSPDDTEPPARTEENDIPF